MKRLPEKRRGEKCWKTKGKARRSRRKKIGEKKLVDANLKVTKHRWIKAYAEASRKMT